MDFAFPAPPSSQHELSDSSPSNEHADDGLPIVLEPEVELSSHLATNNKLSSMSISETNMTPDTMKELQVPTHPIASMQEAFAESMEEASRASTPCIPKTRLGTASARRKLLIDQDISEETHALRWKEDVGQQYHQLWKLTAQISFGFYLLLNGIARNEDQVMTILQGHVDEIDEFLETTLDDFDLAQDDINERLKFLKFPLENIDVFDAMLEDRAFRLQIVNGNERIEHVIQRTAKAMNDALGDVQQGLNACKEFTTYLTEEADRAVWRDDRPDMEAVFEAMKGNVEGWYRASVLLQTKGNHLGVALVQLGSIVAEMDRRAGEISRNTRFSAPIKSSPSKLPASPPASPSQPIQNVRRSVIKNLPSDPNIITPAVQAALPAFQLVQDRERTPDPDSQIRESEAQSQTTTSETEAELEFVLAPRTYTPTQSPKPSLAPIQQGAAQEVRQRSLRERFSLKRKDNPQEIVLQPPPTIVESNGKPRLRTYTSASHPDSIPRSHNVVSSPAFRERAAKTPPSRGLDSACCSDLEKPFTPPNIPYSSQFTQTISNSPRLPLGRADFPPAISGSFLSSPRSDQQSLRPITASPNSSPQCPWTATTAPSHIQGHSASSKGSHVPSRLGNRKGPPSSMGMSMASDMTMVTENGRRVKKKRSAFGWLKKAFALSEEERVAFEERRRMTDYEAGAYYKPASQRWIDGKKVR